MGLRRRLSRHVDGNLRLDILLLNFLIEGIDLFLT